MIVKMKKLKEGWFSRKMDNLYNINVIKKVMSKHRVNFSKSLGQNFLVNGEICPMMAKQFEGIDNLGILEIGPGVGVLTNELAKVADKVLSIEIDKSLLPVLKETVGEYNNVKIINDDAMNIDLNKLISDEFGNKNVCICANLPYYITSPIIMKILEERVNIKSMVLMVQKEAAIRLCAKPGDKNSSAISVSVRYYSNPYILEDVKRDNFIPSPKVDSSIIRLDILDKPPVEVKDELKFFKIVKASFALRRKTIENSLSASLGISKGKIKELLIKSSIDGSRRAEELSIEDFKRISDNF